MMICHTSCVDVAVIAIVSLSTSKGCLGCDGKIVSDAGDEMGHCTKCSIIQVLSEGEDVHQTSKTPGGNITVDAFFQCLKEIVGNMDVSVHCLLGSPPFTMTHRDRVLQTGHLPTSELTI